jgi:hypothetical protein
MHPFRTLRITAFLSSVSPACKPPNRKVVLEIPQLRKGGRTGGREEGEGEEARKGGRDILSPENSLSIRQGHGAM